MWTLPVSHTAGKECYSQHKHNVTGFAREHRRLAEWSNMEKQTEVLAGCRDAWLAQFVEYASLDLRVLSLSPMLGVEKKKKKEA